MSKRSLILKFNDGSEKELVISKATMVKLPTGRLNIDEMNDGTYRILWNEELVPDFSKLDRIEVKRED